MSEEHNHHEDDIKYDGLKFQVYKAKNGEWRWRLRAKNHEIIAVSSEGYKARADLDKAIHMVKDSCVAPVEEEE